MLVTTVTKETSWLQRETEFRDVLADPEKSEQAILELRNYFKALNFTQDHGEWQYYFRWYTALTWERFGTITEEVLLEEAVKRQIVAATLLGYNVWREIITYLASWTYTEERMQSLYLKIKNVFISSGAIVGYLKGQPITVSKVVEEANLIYQQGNSTLEQAEFKSKIKQIVSCPEDQFPSGTVEIDYEESVKKLVGLINFFFGVDEEDIFYVVQEYLHPQTGTEATEEIEEGDTGVEENLEVLDTSPIEKKTPDLTQVKENIISEGLSGDEPILGRLQELAEEYGDPTITEMYYFDEVEGKFKWK